MNNETTTPATPAERPADARPTKAVILARGLGTRMRRPDESAALSAEQARVASTGVKAMMPVGDNGAHPFVEHLISALADAGLTDICLVIGPEHDMVRAWFATRHYERVSISFAVQEEALGTADAVRAARVWAGSERFVMVNSDNYYPADALRELVAAPGTALLGFDPVALVEQSNIPADRVAAFAILASDEAGRLVDIVEKPDPQQRAALGADARVSMNCFSFGPTIFDACDRVEPSPRGELELIDAVRHLVEDGETVTVVPVSAGVLDMSGQGDVSAVATRLADQAVRL